jgi:hypothetical protein
MIGKKKAVVEEMLCGKWIPPIMKSLLGNSSTPYADRGCTDSCSSEGKAH